MDGDKPPLPPRMRSVSAETQAFCARLDAAEHDERNAHAALVIARYEINRARLRSLPATRRRKT